MKPITPDLVEQLTKRAERYKDKLVREVKVLEACVRGDYGSPNEGAQLEKVEIIRQDTAAAIYLARCATIELAAQIPVRSP